MKILFSERAWLQYRFWQEDDEKLLGRINDLLDECIRHPFKGTGKPEPLGGNLSGWWSRRITDEHRLVYRVSGKGDGQMLEIAQCRYHYCIDGLDADGLDAGALGAKLIPPAESARSSAG